MAVISARNFAVLEDDFSTRYADFSVTLDAPATAATTFSYYLQDVTARAGTDYGGGSGTVTFAVGEQAKVVRVPVYGDTAVEGNENFRLVIVAGANATLTGNAAALVATGGIYDDDDSAADGAQGSGAAAQQLAGPASASSTLPTLNIRDVSVLEGNSGASQTVRFLVTLNRPATADVTFDYYFLDGTASSAHDDYFNTSRTNITIRAGQQSTWIETTVYGDGLIEGNQTFQVVLTDIRNGVFVGNAPAVSATATIIDDDAGAPNAGAGIGNFGAGIATQPSASSTVPTVSVRDASVIEGNAGNAETIRFLVTLDRPATAAMTFSYYFQDGTASHALDDYFGGEGSITFQAGQQSAWISATVYGDNANEGSQTFKLVLTSVENGVFAGNAAALTATGTIIDDDNGAPTLAGSIGAFGTALNGAPSASSVLPTLSVRDTALYEGNSNGSTARFLITLDRVATADITFSYYFEDGTASGAAGDFNGYYSSATIVAGQKSTWVEVSVYGDQIGEANETFNLVLNNLRNAVFADAAPALRATGTIINDDSGNPTLNGGIGDFADPLAAQPSASSTLPTISVRDVSIYEGNSSSEAARFLVTLDRPATANITFSYVIQDGSASDAADDYSGGYYGTATIEAGEQSTWIETSVYGDNIIEGNETFYLTLSSVTGAVFAYGAPTLVATGTIIDDDGGAPTRAGGLGSFGSEAVGPAGSGPTPVMRVVSTSVNEGEYGTYAFVHVLLSSAPTSMLEVEYLTQAGTASQDTDFYSNSGTLRFEPGERSGWVQIYIPGDTALEGDESFKLIFSNISGGTFEGGGATAEATILIRDNDGTGTAGSPDAGPQFILATHGTEGADTLDGNSRVNNLYGLGGADFLKGLTGNDSLFGGEGDDHLYGGLGADAHNGGGGLDYARYDDANYGAVRASLAAPGTNTGAAAGDTYVDIEGLVGGAANDVLYGNSGANPINGQGGDDVLLGGLGADRLVGGAGIDYARYDDANYGNLVLSLLNPAANTSAGAGDTYSGIEGLMAGAGNDRVDGNTFANYLYGLGGNDTILGNAGTDTLSGGAGQDKFVFNTALNATTNVDRILDFNVADDIIWVDQTYFIGLAIGALASGAFNTGAAATQADDRIIYNSSTGALIFDANGNAAGGATQFATLNAGLALTAADFNVIA